MFISILPEEVRSFISSAKFRGALGAPSPSITSVRTALKTRADTKHSMGTKGGFTWCCPLSKQDIMSRLQRGFIFSLFQLLSQLLFCQPEILQESREPLSDNRADNTNSCKYFTQTFDYCLMSTVLLENTCAN